MATRTEYQIATTGTTTLEFDTQVAVAQGSVRAKSDGTVWFAVVDDGSQYVNPTTGDVLWAVLELQALPYSTDDGLTTNQSASEQSTIGHVALSDTDVRYVHMNGYQEFRPA